MPTTNELIDQYIEKEVIEVFYAKKLSKLKELKLNNILSRKNPYLFKAKDIQISGDLIKFVLDAYLSSQEETIFGNLLEGLAIYIASIKFSGYKAEESKYKSIDLILERDSKVYIIGIKSGPYWGNADQQKKLKENFKLARKQLRKDRDNQDLEIVSVNGCIYGKEVKSFTYNDKELNYEKLCGQAFWELVSGDQEFYKYIIEPMEQRVKLISTELKKAYTQKVNQFTQEFSSNFCVDNQIDWQRLIEFVSKNK